MDDRKWFNAKSGAAGPGHRALRGGRISLCGATYFVTKCVAERASLLANPTSAAAIIGSLRWLVSNRYAICWGFVVMPDHYHAILELCGNKSLSDAMASIDRYTARRINFHLGRGGAFWQRGYYDHAVRGAEELEDILAYVHANPVRAGIAATPNAWPYSSLNLEHAKIVAWASHEGA